MTLRELLNQKLPNTPKLDSITFKSLESSKEFLQNNIHETDIDEWIQTGLLNYSRKSKNNLKILLQVLEVSDIDSVILIHRFEEKKYKPVERAHIDSKIDWKAVLINVTATDGVELKGILEYWSKDYTVCMREPFEANCGGTHLMYSVPVVYATTEEARKGVKYLYLLETAKEALLDRYENRNKTFTNQT